MPPPPQVLIYVIGVLGYIIWGHLSLVNTEYSKASSEYNCEQLKTSLSVCVCVCVPHLWLPAVCTTPLAACCVWMTPLPAYSVGGL